MIIHNPHFCHKTCPGPSQEHQNPDRISVSEEIKIQDPNFEKEVILDQKFELRVLSAPGLSHVSSMVKKGTHLQRLISCIGGLLPSSRTNQAG